MLQNLYRLKALGFSYSDPFVTNRPTQVQTLPNDMMELQTFINDCYLCDLNKSRHQSMSGTGNINADVMFVDSYVSTAEDDNNGYFVGKSGESLVNMIEKVIGLKKEQVFFTHAVKCKPLGTNKPSKSEYNSCKPYLFKQLELIQPKVVVTLGEEAYYMLSGDDTPFEQVRGQKVKFDNYTIIPIFHPQYLLRNPSMKRDTLQDLKTIKSAL